MLEILMQFLYEGDHIYGNILQSKKELGNVTYLVEIMILK